MKKLTQDELSQLKFRGTGNKTPNPLISEARSIGVGDSVLISREEWKNKTAPNATNKVFKFSSRVLADGSGWVLTRKA